MCIRDRALAGRGQRARRAAFELPADHLEGQVLVALHAEDAHQAPEIVLRVQAVAGLRAARRDQALLLAVPQLADADVGELAVQAVSYTHLRAHETVLDLVCRL